MTIDKIAITLEHISAEVSERSKGAFGIIANPEDITEHTDSGKVTFSFSSENLVAEVSNVKNMEELRGKTVVALASFNIDGKKVGFSTIPVVLSYSRDKSLIGVVTNVTDAMATALMADIVEVIKCVSRGDDFYKKLAIVDTFSKLGLLK